MLRITINESAFSASLDLEGLSEDKTYVVGDQLKGKLTFKPKRDLTILTMNGELSYVVDGRTNTNVVQAHQLKLMSYRKFEEGETCKFDVNIPFRFGRPNFKGENLDSFWEFKLLILREVPEELRTILQMLPGMDRKLMEADFTIPVSAGKGNYRVKARPLEIPLVDGQVAGIASFLALGFMVVFGVMFNDTGVNSWVYLAIALTGLIGILLYHFLRLSSFKMTPMEIKPLRDGKIRIRYLNRGKNHLTKAYIGVRVKEHYIKEDINDRNSGTTSVIHEERHRLNEAARPLDHLNEVTIPWPKGPDGAFPTSYTYKEQGYEWEVFLTASGLNIGGLNEIRWLIHVDWERMWLTAPTKKELEEEKLELRELADNRVPS